MGEPSLIETSRAQKESYVDAARAKALGETAGTGTSRGQESSGPEESSPLLAVQWWSIKKVEKELEPPVELGPVEWRGFSFEGEANPAFGTKGAPPGGGEGEPTWQFHGGFVLEKGEHGAAFGVQSELEYVVQQKLTALGYEWTPWVKGEGKLTTEGAEVSVQGRLESDPVAVGLKFTVLEIKWNEKAGEKPEVRWAEPTATVEYRWEGSVGELFQWAKERGYIKRIPAIHPLDAMLEIKATFGFRFRVNWAWSGWKTLWVTLRQTASDVVAFFVTETGELTLAGAVGVAAVVVVAYVAWMGYGLYQLNLAHERGRRAGATEQFLDGYAQMLTELTSTSPTVDLDYVNRYLLDMDWKATLKEYMEAYVTSQVQLLASSPVYRAGQAAIAIDYYNIVKEQGPEAWRALAVRLRNAYGGNDATRAQAFRQALRTQIQAGDDVVGISLTG